MKKPSTDDPIHILHEYDLDLDNREVFLLGQEHAHSEEENEPGVEFTMANKFIRNMNLLRKGKIERILIHMKTCGGDWQEGMAIYDTIRYTPNHCTILNYTHARSMSSIILQAAARRVMMPNSYIMFHEGDTMVQGTLKQVQSSLQFDKKDTATMLEIYASRMKEQGIYSKWTKKRIKAKLKDLMDKKEDVYLTAKEAVLWGLADEIFNGRWEKLK